jgi:DNA-binding NarL/FixJ family response regulator
MHPDPTNTTVLLVDDHTFMREGIRSILNDYEDMQVVGEATDGGEAIQYARMLKPHVILMVSVSHWGMASFQKERLERGKRGKSIKGMPVRPQ